MNGGEVFMLFLGPLLALGAGLAIYGIAARSNPRSSASRTMDRH